MLLKPVLFHHFLPKLLWRFRPLSITSFGSYPIPTIVYTAHLNAPTIIVVVIQFFFSNNFKSLKFTFIYLFKYDALPVGWAYVYPLIFILFALLLRKCILLKALYNQYG